MARSSTRHTNEVGSRVVKQPRLNGGQLRSSKVSGTESDTNPAIIEVSGTFLSGKQISSDVSLNAAAALNSPYTPASDEDAETVATGLAAVINAETGLDAVANGANILVTATAAGAVQVVGLTVTA
jgi:hypothetical protein